MNTLDHDIKCITFEPEPQRVVVDVFGLRVVLGVRGLEKIRNRKAGN